MIICHHLTPHLGLVLVEGSDQLKAHGGQHGHRSLGDEEDPVPRGQRRRPAPEAPHLLRLHQAALVQGTHRLCRHARHPALHHHAAAHRGQRLHVARGSHLAARLQGAVGAHVGARSHLHRLQRHAALPVVDGRQVPRPVHRGERVHGDQVIGHAPRSDHRRGVDLRSQGLQGEVAQKEEGDAAPLMRRLPHQRALGHVLHQPMPEIVQAVNVMISFAVAPNKNPLCGHQDEHTEKLLEGQQGKQHDGYEPHGRHKDHGQQNPFSEE